jgi:tetratricopeptide (TPR) repeat protein
MTVETMSNPRNFGRETNGSMPMEPSEVSLSERLERGIAFKIEGNYADAEREIKFVLEADPNCARAHRELGLVLNFTGFFEESLDELRKSVELDGTCLDTRNELALAYSMLGMMDEAKREFEAVLELDPTNATAQRNLVYFQ